MLRKTLVVVLFLVSLLIFCVDMVIASQNESKDPTEALRLAAQLVKVMGFPESIVGNQGGLAEQMDSDGVEAFVAEQMDSDGVEAKVNLVMGFPESIVGNLGRLAEEIGSDGIERSLNVMLELSYYMDAGFFQSFSQTTLDLVNPFLIILFADMYTEEELKALISLYQSPIGKTISKSHPIVAHAGFIKQMLGDDFLDFSSWVYGHDPQGLPVDNELEVEIVGEGKDMSVKISMHPDESFNGEYKVQEGLINDWPWYKTTGLYSERRYLYFYDQAEGGEKSWSLDHRKPNGSTGWSSGGWISPTEALPHPPPGAKPWSAVSYWVYDGGMAVNLELVGEGESKAVRISMHFEESFDGTYEVQEGLINDRPWYKNDKNRYLYFYADVNIETLSAIGDEEWIRQWNLDHREPDGVSNWSSGGWISPTEGLSHPETGMTDVYPGAFE